MTDDVKPAQKTAGGAKTFTFVGDKKTVHVTGSKSPQEAVDKLAGALKSHDDIEVKKNE